MRQQPDLNQKNSKNQTCDQCEGKGYTEIRDCAGEIQRTDTCSFCEGKGYQTPDESVV